MAFGAIEKTESGNILLEIIQIPIRSHNVNQTAVNCSRGSLLECASTAYDFPGIERLKFFHFHQNQLWSINQSNYQRSKYLVGQKNGEFLRQQSKESPKNVSHPRKCLQQEISSPAGIHRISQRASREKVSLFLPFFFSIFFFSNRPFSLQSS